MKCKLHPKYAAKRAPTADCWFCMTIWDCKHKEKQLPKILKNAHSSRDGCSCGVKNCKEFIYAEIHNA